MNKKKLGVTLGSLALVGAIGFSATLAYLSDQTQTLNNTFVIGDKIDIELDEKDITSTTGGRTQDGNKYLNVLPGVAFEKDPTVTFNTPTTEAYVFMAMKESKDVTPVEINPLWVKVEDKTLPEGVKVYRYHTTINNDTVDSNPNVDGLQLPALFTEAVLRADHDGSSDIDNIKVSAAAIQSGGLTEDKAYAELRDFLVSVE